MSTLDTLDIPEKDTTYFAFRVPTQVHHTMRSILARRGITCQAFFLRIVEDLIAEEESATGRLKESVL